MRGTADGPRPLPAERFVDRPAFLVQHWPDHLGDAVEHFGEFVGESAPVRSAEVLDGVTEVVGPVLDEEGRAVHEAFGW